MDEAVLTNHTVLDTIPGPPPEYSSNHYNIVTTSLPNYHSYGRLGDTCGFVGS